MTINGQTKAAGLLGYPVRHTKSPMIHNTLAGAEDNNMVYLPFEVKPEDLESAVKGAFALGLVGMNVTVPHKEKVIPFLEDIDPLASAIGAVNTLVRGKEGYIGYNTDILGLKMALDQAGIPIRGEKVLILGAGGAARAVSFLCAREGAAELVIANRSIDKAESIREDLLGYLANEGGKNLGESSIRAVSLGKLTEEIPDESGRYLAFQCSSVGLAPDMEGCILSGDTEGVFDRISAGVDLIYKPMETVFMRKLREQGKTAMGGLDMLLYQGVIAYELWRGRGGEKIETDPKLLDQIREKLQEDV
ncbi:MAG: shikimate dehydrogenase [Lachnospiraceae bacterium]|nr:shikimate dehydrogenase [Lachnospiraceae bacterium]